MADATTPQAVGLVDFDELEYLREIHQLNDEALAVFASAAGELIEAGWEFLSNNRTGDDPEHVIYSGQGFTEKHLERAAKWSVISASPTKASCLISHDLPSHSASSIAPPSMRRSMKPRRAIPNLTQCFASSMTKADSSTPVRIGS
jgi:hypothetical protein